MKSQKYKDRSMIPNFLIAQN